MSSSLAWVTPFSAASDISAFSHNLLLEFGRVSAALDATVTLFVNENGPRYWSQLPTISLTGTNVDREMLLGYDFVVLNIGNNLANHEHINRLAIDLPAVVIVHDLVMHHAVASLLQLGVRRPDKRSDGYALLMGACYGMRGLEVVSQSQQSAADNAPLYSPWETSQVAAFPLIEPFIDTAAAVVLHSAYAQAALRPPLGTPVLRLALPWDQKTSPSDRALQHWAKRTETTAKCAIVCIGHISSSKCLEQVILAFAHSPLLRGAAGLTIAGHPTDPACLAQLRRLVAQYDLSGCIDFEISVSDERLQEIKLEADLFVNLRYPNTESASGSLIEQLNSGKPVVIYPSGAYGEIDAEAVISVDRSLGVAALATALETAVVDPSRRVTIGAAGRAFVRRIGRQEYVAQLWAFLGANREVLRARKACTAGRREVPALTSQEVGCEWLAGLKRARRLFAGLQGRPFEIEVMPFLEWTDDALAVYVATGVFGQTPDSALEVLLRAELPGAQRADWYDAVAHARIVWQLTEDPSLLEGALRHCVATPLLLPKAWLVLAALGQWTLVRCCYVGLLGRPADLASVAAHVTDPLSATLGGLLRRFIESDEFLARRIAPVDLAALRQSLTSNDVRTATLSALPQGVTVAFTASSPNCQAYLAGGWHDPDTTGTWSRTSNAAVLFSIDAGAPQLDLTVIGRLIGPSGENRLLQIRSNGIPVFARTCEGDDELTLAVRIERTAGAPSAHALEIDCEHTVSPFDFGYNDDCREIGFFLVSLALTEALAP